MDRGDARLGSQDPDQVERVGGAQHDQLIDSLELANRAQPTDRVMRFLDAAGVAKREKRNNPEKAIPRKERKANAEQATKDAETAAAAAKTAKEAKAAEAKAAEAPAAS